MRKKSHLSLAGYIIDTDEKYMSQHPFVFKYGSLEPDLVPSFLTTRHRIDLTFDKLEKKINNVIENYDVKQNMTIGIARDMGVITHYIADYFTFPHNIEYPGSMKEHIHYEAVQKIEFKELVEEMKKSQERFQQIQLKTADEICAFIKTCHDEYICHVTNIQNDCRYILKICAQVIGAILGIFDQYSNKEVLAAF